VQQHVMQPDPQRQQRRRRRDSLRPGVASLAAVAGRSMSS
jgi:hypothetical protein